MSTQGIDSKVVDRIKKLLNLARDGGATEHEAALAMDRAQGIMREHGLSIASIEASGGVGESREKRSRTGRAHKKWLVDMMEALAESSFVYMVHRAKGSYDIETRRHAPGGYDLIGRQSAVVQVQLMHEYLAATVGRLARERGTPGDELFMAGVGERIIERLHTRHEAMLAEQKHEAAEAKARQSHPGAAPGNALVVVLEDFAQKERDLNRDMARGVPAGTTAKERDEAEQRRVEREQEAKRRREELAARGLDEEVVEWMMVGYTEEQARKLAEPKPPKPPKEETEAQRERREEREERERLEWRERRRRREEREAARTRHPSYRAGRAAGDKVGLDTQVERTERRKLS